MSLMCTLLQLNCGVLPAFGDTPAVQTRLKHVLLFNHTNRAAALNATISLTALMTERPVLDVNSTPTPKLDC